MRKRWRLALLALLAGMFALAGGVQTASAHAYLVRTDPRDGTVSATAPTQLRLWFSEAITLKLSSFSLEDSQGRQVPIGPAHAGPADPSSSANSASASGSGDSGVEAAAVVVDVPPLAHGAYRLSWRVISADDLHATTGDIVFGIQSPADIAKLAPTPASAATSPLPSPAEVLFRWLNFAGIAGLVGGLAVAFLVVPASGGQSAPGGEAPAEPTDPLGGGAALQPALVDDMRRRLFRLAMWSGVIGLFAGFGLLAVRAVEVGGSAGLLASVQSVVTTTPYGMHWALGTAALAVLVLLSLALDTPHLPSRTSAWQALALWLRSSGSMRWLPPVLVLALLVFQALQSHTAAAVDSSLLDTVLMTLHLLGACLWTGGLLALAVGCVPLLRRGPKALALARVTLRRFGAPAVTSLVVLAVTGLYAAGRLVATPDALLLSPYGKTLLLKAALVLAVGMLGLTHAASFHPGVASMLGRILRRSSAWKPLSISHMRRTIVLEASGAAVVVLLAAALAGSQPARGPGYDPPAADASTTSQPAGRADDLFVVADVKPDHPGANFITLSIYNTRRPAPAPIDSVDIQFVAPDGQEVTAAPVAALGSNKYQVAGQSLAEAGDWRLVVVVHRSRLPDATVAMPWSVVPLAQPASATQPLLISRQPLAPFVNVAALVLALLAACAAGVWWLKRHSAALPEVAPSPEQRVPAMAGRE